jgi:hypothetical protein
MAPRKRWQRWKVKPHFGPYFDISIFFCYAACQEEKLLLKKLLFIDQEVFVPITLQRFLFWKRPAWRLLRKCWLVQCWNVISGSDQAFLHFLAAWLHRKNEPKKKTRIDRDEEQLAFYGSKKSCLIYFQICPRQAAAAFFMVLLAEKRGEANSSQQLPTKTDKTVKKSPWNLLCSEHPRRVFWGDDDTYKYYAHLQGQQTWSADQTELNEDFCV